jgi:glycine dehydrogenase subunit 1
MLDVIGVDSIDRLFDTIPDDVKLKDLLDLPGPWSEVESRRWFRGLAARNKTSADHVSFLGGGAYAHYQPACIDQLLLRAEFLTAYTPYQPEVSQGTLQSIFEYQTHQCLLTGLDVANASLYDGSTALCEAVLLAERSAKGKKKVLVAKSIHPHYLDTVHTYLQNLGLEIVEIGWGADGRVDLDALRAASEGAFAVAIQSPNFLGVIEDYDAVGRPRAVSPRFPSSRGDVIGSRPPGQHGFSSASAKGRACGVPTVRRPVRRLHGRARCAQGHMPAVESATGVWQGAYAHATREQHIRRGKATSNPHERGADRAREHVSLAGGQAGLARVATQCLQKTAYLREKLKGTARSGFRSAVGLQRIRRADAVRGNTNPRDSSTRHPRRHPAPARSRSHRRDSNAVTELNTREDLDHFNPTLPPISRERDEESQSRKSQSLRRTPASPLTLRLSHDTILELEPAAMNRSRKSQVSRHAHPSPWMGGSPLV